MYVEDFSVSRRTGFEDYFWDTGDSVFVNGLSVINSLCAKKMSSSAVELGFKDYFWDTRDSVFINGLSVMNSLCAQKMSSSVVDLGFLDDFWVLGTSFSSTVSVLAVVYLH